MPPAPSTLPPSPTSGYIQHPPLYAQHRVLCLLPQSLAPYPLHPIPAPCSLNPVVRAHPLNSAPIGPSLPKAPCPLRPEPHALASVSSAQHLYSTKCPSRKPSVAQLRPRPQSHFSLCITGSALVCSWSLSFHSGSTSGSVPAQFLSTIPPILKRPGSL